MVEVGPGVELIGVLKSSALPLLDSAAMSTAVATKAMESVPATLGAWVSVDTSSTDQVASEGPFGSRRAGRRHSTSSRTWERRRG